MGEYAQDRIRAETLRLFGFDPGEEAASKRPPAAKRVRCPLCNHHPKEAGLQDHLRDKHQVTPEAAQ